MKGLAKNDGVVALTPNEKRTAEDRRECYWLYVVTRRKRPESPRLTTLPDPAQIEQDEIRRVDHYARSFKDLAGNASPDGRGRATAGRAGEGPR